jgi:predicted transcriptional regulator
VRGFGELEAVIMDILWRRDGPATVRDVLEHLRADREIAYTTVMTVMDNLHRKGWLRREREGRAYRYEPVATREEYSAGLMREALTASEDPASTFVHFLSQIDPAESAALRAALGRLTGDAEP